MLTLYFEWRRLSGLSSRSTFRCPWHSMKSLHPLIGHSSNPGADFRPLPLLGNAHVQTVLGALWKGRPLTGDVREQHVALDDGDRLAVHVSQPGGWRPGDPVALLVHGLG